MCYICFRIYEKDYHLMSTTKKSKTSSVATTLSAKSLSSKEDYEKKKRQIKPVSFNRIDDQRILEIAGSFNFSVWVKNLLNALTPSEVLIIKADVSNNMEESELTFIPALLIEKAIENGYFNLDEYLEAKGKKIVDIEHNKPGHNDYAQYDETCQLPDHQDDFS